MKSFNRQTVNKFRKMSVPAAIMMIVSTIISGIGTFLRYKEELMPSACTNGWIQYDNYCYLDPNIKMSADNAIIQCHKLKARLPNAYTRHLKVLYTIFSKDYWISLKKTDNNTWIDSNNNKKVDITKLPNYKQLNNTSSESCHIYKAGRVSKSSTCKVTHNVICVKKFYK
ncbi:IEV and EEV membrane glycoprotein [Murmansk poxvirus]|uniref:IEV and EEV membrane glycoprotein n=1 Tax=Murmansk poxvirus TaxID=2025359 RepID=A0A223FMX6_9POXV|nr:IEV and EEV membrane glycoprotein [Murmansk poxvirus]YP_009408535.1 C-type lectin-like IEV/EEV glycoprotein [NY_014 poxvirus]AST09346.1 IEV and EEV membrane glycoprotein [Murmansk poxvirus]AST09548.1 C-type lectin-like IEV/EEV glycoprotein [NY_014 poxvirus]